VYRWGRRNAENNGYSSKEKGTKKIQGGSKVMLFDD